MLEAVLWDFGGVLTTSPFESFSRYEADNGLPPDLIRTINATNSESNAWAQFESSQVSLDEFDEMFRAESAAVGHPIGGKEVVALLSGELRPRMIEVLKICKEHFKVGCITNNVKSGLGPSMARDEERAAQSAAVMEIFDIIVASSIEGVRKPNPRIYEIACQRLGVAPENCAFLDDLGVNLKPARALGMSTIKVLSEDQAISELSTLTGLAELAVNLLPPRKKLFSGGPWSGELDC